MTITKLGHCCLLIKEGGLTILTDPGTYTTSQNDIVGIDMVLITHEHGDHFHIDSLKKILVNNPKAKVVTNSSVGKLLDPENISYTVVDDGKELVVNDVVISGKGTIHAEIHPSLPRVENTGYFINKKLYYPGDAFHDPGEPVDILALPVAGPWMKISEALDFGAVVKPRIIFPVHDGMFNKLGGGFVSRIGKMFFEKAGIKYVALELGVPTDL